jgi:hypothetical protein
MKGRVALLTGTAIGYVLGTRAGRERYEQIKAQAQKIRSNPTVQAKAAQAQDYAKQQAPVVKDKAAEAASSAAGAAKDAAQSAKDKAGSGPDTNGGSAPYPTSATTGLR